MIRQMRDIVDTAQHTTRKARRDTERRQHLKTLPPPGRPALPLADIPDTQTEGQPPATPFDQIEEW
jgi:putative transposase